MIILSPIQVVLIAIVIPVLSVGFSLLAVKIANSKQNGVIGRICSAIAYPVPLQVVSSIENETSQSEYHSDLKRQIGYRLVLVYFFVGLFFISNLLATFYHIIADLSMYYIDPGFTSRVWSGIGFESPLFGGWIGSFEWYGQRFLPPADAEIFHEVWNWIFFSAGMTDDVTFFFGAIRSVLIFTFILGLLFLLPLAKKSIRKSFLPSMFFFSAGMSIVTRGIFGLLGQAWKLQFANEYLRYGAIVVSSGQLQVTSELTLISMLVPVVIALFIVFFIGGRKLWRVHYPQKFGVLNWFSVYIVLQYWISLLLIVNL